jgi:Helitron helicase-like domain at N-terminus
MMRDNPLIVAYWFHFRFQTYKKMVLSKKFPITDNWDRYEWQGRGSTHNHGVFWLDGAPSPEVDELDDATRTEFAKWWALYISAWNPEPNHGAHRMDEISAISLPLDRQENRVSHLSVLPSKG